VTGRGSGRGHGPSGSSMPLARDVVKDLAIEHGACLRPVQLRRTDLATGQTEPVLVPCGHTLASVCPSCAERAKNLRATQCREGWHMDAERVIEPDQPTGSNGGGPRRADAQAIRDQAERDGDDTSVLDEPASANSTTTSPKRHRGNVLPNRPERRPPAPRGRRQTRAAAQPALPALRGPQVLGPLGARRAH